VKWRAAAVLSGMPTVAKVKPYIPYCQYYTNPNALYVNPNPQNVTGMPNYPPLHPNA